MNKVITLETIKMNSIIAKNDTDINIDIDIDIEIQTEVQKAKMKYTSTELI